MVGLSVEAGGSGVEFLFPHELDVLNPEDNSDQVEYITTDQLGRALVQVQLDKAAPSFDPCSESPLPVLAADSDGGGGVDAGDAGVRVKRPPSANQKTVIGTARRGSTPVAAGNTDGNPWLGVPSTPGSTVDYLAICHKSADSDDSDDSDVATMAANGDVGVRPVGGRRRQIIQLYAV